MTRPDLMTELSDPSHRIAVTTPRLLRSEWTKFRSLRSTWWALGAGLALMIGASLLASMDKASQLDTDTSAASVARATQIGVFFAQLAVLSLAALFVTGEYGTGMVRATMTAVPARIPVLQAKVVVVSTIVFVGTTLSAVVSFLLGAAVWHAHGHHAVGLGDPSALRIVAGTPLYLTVCAVLAVAVGSLVRSTAATLTLLLGAFFVVPSVGRMIPGISAISPYLPSNAGGAINGLTFALHPLGPWTGFGLFLGYAAACWLVACPALRRRDV